MALYPKLVLYPAGLISDVDCRDFHSFKDHGNGCYSICVNITQVKGHQGKQFMLTLGGKPDIRKEIVIYKRDDNYSILLPLSFTVVSLSES